MNKILPFLLLSFMASSTNIFSMESKKDLAKRDAKEFTKLDGAKVAAASLGFGLFALAAARVYPIMKCANSNIKNESRLNIPLALVGTPFAVAASFMMPKDKKVKDSPTAKNIILGLAGVTTALCAGGCGWYIWKKVSKLKSKSPQKSSAEIKDRI